MIWSTRTICTFVAATVPVEEKGAENSLLEEALKIGVAATGTEESAAPARGVKVETDEYGRSREVAEIDPRETTFESFMGSFGDPRRWAGRS